MKLVFYEILDKTIHLNFNKQFKQIKYIKFTNKNDKTDELQCDKTEELECDETEIKFTKGKMTINIYNEDYTILIIHIKEIDNNKCDYAYYINLNKESCKENSNISNIENEFIGVGLSKLFNNFEEKTIEKKWECVIKNRNIFANIKRKVEYGDSEIN